jgi:hypothetical protein
MTPENRGLFKPFPSADKQPAVHRIEYGDEERRQRFRKVSLGEDYLSFGHWTNSKMTQDSF